MRVGIIVFPGSNCDRDALRAVDDVLGSGTGEAVWHTETELDELDAFIVPGGFSWGDYLRTGALTRFAPVMTALREAADDGTPVLGICNGFQVLCEARLLPGALLRNDHSRFRCDIVDVEVESTATPWTNAFEDGAQIRLPIAHGDGRFHADLATLDALDRDGRIVVRYTSSNPNGSCRAIAGISSERGNVVGMMPHPERAVRTWMGSDDGVLVLESLRRSLSVDITPHLAGAIHVGIG